MYPRGAAMARRRQEAELRLVVIPSEARNRDRPLEGIALYRDDCDSSPTARNDLESRRDSGDLCSIANGSAIAAHSGPKPDLRQHLLDAAVVPAVLGGIEAQQRGIS